MQEQQFLDLIKKYNQGKCSKTEQQLLFKFCEKLQVTDITKSWNLSEEEEEKIEIFRRINETLNSNKYSKRRKFNKRRLQPIAAIFIGLIALGYLYLTNVSDINTIPLNAITLELENGNIKILEQDGTAKVISKNGNIVGQQNGSLLVYNDKNTSRDLIYNTLKVPFGKTFQIQLSDGTKAHINAGSTIKYPIQFVAGMNRQVFVTGEAYLEVAKDSAHPFIVNAGDLNVSVLGTQFNVSAYPEDNAIEVVLVEGSVSLYTKDFANEKENTTLLKPGFKGSLNKKEKRITKQEVSTNIYTSWREGKLVFRNMTFKNILKKLERHYDIVIVNNNDMLANKKFNANFGDKTIIQVLEELSKNYGIKYNILKKKEIIIN